MDSHGPPERRRFSDRRVGDQKPFIVRTSVRGAAKNPTSARAIGYDPGPSNQVSGTNSETGSTSTLSASGLTGADDKWNGMGVWIEVAASGRRYKARVTDWVLATGILTFTTLTETVAQGDTWEMFGEPLMELASASVSGSQTTVDANQAQHAYEGTRRIDIELTFSATDVEWVEYEYEVWE